MLLKIHFSTDLYSSISNFLFATLRGSPKISLHVEWNEQKYGRQISSSHTHMVWGCFKQQPHHYFSVQIFDIYFPEISCFTFIYLIGLSFSWSLEFYTQPNELLQYLAQYNRQAQIFPKCPIGAESFHNILPQTGFGIVRCNFPFSYIEDHIKNLKSIFF